MTRNEHMDWCKERAFEYLESGDTNQAFISMMSDLGKHPETENHIGIQLGMIEMMTGNLSSIEQMRRFIDGFH